MQVLSTHTSGATRLGEPLRIDAGDGFPLGATVFEPRSDAAGTVVVHGAMAVPAAFYGRYALFLANRGLRVVTYDYRGIGASRPPQLRGFDARMTDWARVDAASVHRFVDRRWAGRPVALVGHSFGGQLLGLIDEARCARGAVLVGAQLGYYGDFPTASRLGLTLAWRAALPALTATFGYLPGQAGLGEDVPRGVAEQWARWSSSPAYFLHDEPDAHERFGRFEAPVLFYTFTDDAMAPRRAVDRILSELTRARVDHRRIHPREVGEAEVGHFGFFRQRLRATLWGDSAQFLADVLAGRTPAFAPTEPGSFGITMADILSDLHVPTA